MFHFPTIEVIKSNEKNCSSLTEKTNQSIMIEIELKKEETIITTEKEGLVVWIGTIVIHNEGHVNLMIWVYSGYTDMCKDYKEGQR